MIVGANPSLRSTTSKAFDQSTKSGTLLRDWIGPAWDSTFCEFALTNVYGQPTPDNRPPNKAEIEEGKEALKEFIQYFNPHRIVSIGKVPAKVLTQMGLEFYEMPHPSGLNRKLNDKEWAEEKIKGLRHYISIPLLNDQDLEHQASILERSQDCVDLSAVSVNVSSDSR